ncbi:MAG: isoleucine--tRNA ligase [bacterium]
MSAENNKKGETVNFFDSVAAEKVLDFWDKAKTFPKSVAKEAPKGDYVFYDGPPFATGMPHYGHIVASTMKDAVQRYRTMTGYRVERRWGWDCHGLPIENIAEKELGSKKKKDIEEMGVGKFNELCRSKVSEYAEGWKKVIRKLGRWVDMEQSWKTMDLEFMESVWWVFKELWDKGLIYESYRSMHICPRCETTLSQTEVSEGYKMVKDLSATVKFKLEPKQELDGFTTDDNTHILAWTTTPWTLIGNVALAVGKDIQYAVVDMDKQSAELKGKYIIAVEKMGLLAEQVKKKQPDKPWEIDKLIYGKGLVGLKYEPLFSYYATDEKLENRTAGWKVYAGDFVTTEDGTGVVHIAPAFGEDDMNLGKQYNLPFVQHVKMDGIIKEEALDFAGRNVKPIDDPQSTDVEIIKYLAHHGLLFHKEKFEHSYPHCWRCETPLINYATSSWFVNILKIKENLLAEAKNINWFPEYIKEGRFGNWLAGARDWSISRQRFWASVIPIWKCACGEMKAFGSVVELEKASGQTVTDLHKHFVDKIKFSCPKCGGTMERIPDVLDTWFDSGSMPYAQIHYPFENKDKFDDNFPAEFIAEGIDQTSCWFYYLHVIAVAIKGKNAFKNVIVNGIVLAEDGKKMSKKLQNYPDPLLVLDKYGADALRFYLLSSTVVAAENLNFSEDGVKETLRKNIMTLENVFRFYELFKEDGDLSLSFDEAWQSSDNILDKWILISLNKLIAETTAGMEKYNLVAATRPITDFIDDLSTWYLRRSRDRFKADNQQAKAAARRTLGFVLKQTVKIMAPFAPFVTEHIWQKISGNNFADNNKSVHLEVWPEVSSCQETEVLEKMALTRRIVELGLAQRKQQGIKVRQPLQKLIIRNEGNILEQLGEEYLDLVKDEVNIKEVEFEKKAGNLEVELDTKMTPELELEGLARDIVRTVNSLRKEAGLSINDSAALYYSAGDKLDQVFAELGKDILKEVLCSEYKAAEMDQFELKKEIMIKGQPFFIGIKSN